MNNLSVALKALFGSLDYYTPTQHKLAIKRAVTLALEDCDQACDEEARLVVVAHDAALSQLTDYSAANELLVAEASEREIYIAEIETENEMFIAEHGPMLYDDTDEL